MCNISLLLDRDTAGRLRPITQALIDAYAYEQ